MTFILRLKLLYEQQKQKERVGGKVRIIISKWNSRRKEALSCTVGNSINKIQYEGQNTSSCI